MRMSMRRLSARKTLSVRSLRICRWQLPHFAHYNLVRLHKTKTFSPARFWLFQVFYLAERISNSRAESPIQNYRTL